MNQSIWKSSGKFIKYSDEFSREVKYKYYKKFIDTSHNNYRSVCRTRFDFEWIASRKELLFGVRHMPSTGISLAFTELFSQQNTGSKTNHLKYRRYFIIKFDENIKLLWHRNGGVSIVVQFLFSEYSCIHFVTTDNNSA
jgi:hypothetical protein